MARKRVDSLRVALDTLRQELRVGSHAPGARLTANDIAERLSLSATPVREALYRLAGEGLLQERRGQGFFVPNLQEHDLVALFRLQLALLLIACEAGPSGADGAAEAPGLLTPGASSAASEERLLRALAARASPALAQHLSRLQDQLAPFLISGSAAAGGAPSDIARLADAVARCEPDRLRRELQDLLARRIEAAPQLARLHEARSIESI